LSNARPLPVIVMVSDLVSVRVLLDRQRTRKRAPTSVCTCLLSSSNSKRSSLTTGRNVTRTSETPTLAPTAPISAWARMSSEAVRAANAESAHMRRRSFWWEVWREIYLAGERILPRQCLTSLLIICPLWTCTAAGNTAHSWLALATSSSITSRSARVYQRPRTITPSIRRVMSIPFPLMAFPGAGSSCQTKRGPD
jgi:hypothetical protein